MSGAPILYTKRKTINIMLHVALFSTFWAISPTSFAAETTQELDTSAQENKKRDNHSDVLIVTGEKLNKSIYDTGSSVVVYDYKQIEDIPNPDVNTLLQMTPNIVDTGNSNALPAIRGVDGSGPAQGAIAFLAGTRPRVNFSVDGRSFTYNEFGYGAQSLWDVDTVEIFRDPQSYVQGRNAIAGAILVKTLDPTFYWEGAVKGGLGQQGFQQTAAMVSGPLIEDKLAFRFTVEKQERESFTKMDSYSPVGNPRDIESTTVRGKLLYEPLDMPEFKSKLTFTHMDSQSPQNEAKMAKNLAPDAASRFRPVVERKTTSGIWNTSWEANENLTWENTLIYTDFTTHRRTKAPTPRADIDAKEFELEPMLRFKTDSDILNGIVGIRYFHSKQNEFVDLFGGSYYDDKTETSSAYGSLTYTVVPEVDITLSGRFEREQHTRKGGSPAVMIDFDETYNTFLPKADFAWKPIKNQTVGFAVGRGYNGGGAGVTIGKPIVTYTYSPEYVWNYSLYGRNSLLDNKLSIMTNLFYNDYKDMQLPFYLGPDSTTIRNAKKVETYGAEFNVAYQPIESLELNTGVGLLRTKIKDFGDSGIEGKELARAPNYTTNVGAKYQLTSSVDISGNVQFSGDYFSQANNNENSKIDSFWVANLQLGYDFKWGRATVFAQNLFDSDKRILIPDNNIETAIYQRPRMLGATMELRF
ncbi:TonB-dependent receptor [Providencia sneebia]|uniref:Photobactin outer membrane receptor phua n=1 Tax=Providencia sneebia DSM 19967 TaxID=1141660 RepID=K8WPL2_9GAMM|nr:TonB-dependent receptor [Providencia sneebia]EKT59397.1 photobactin outer membrane receptor phua [Providencia sneebia DSM 19967]